MNEENMEQISRSTSAISEWSINLLNNIGVPENWVKYINMILLFVALVILVLIVQYLTKTILRAILNHSAKITKAPIDFSGRKTIPALFGNDCSFQYC